MSTFRRSAGMGGSSANAAVVVAGQVSGRSPATGWSAEQAGRTNKQGSLLPAYSIVNKQGQLGIGGAARFFDRSSPLFWRSAFAVIAVAYIYGFHASIGRIRINFGG